MRCQACGEANAADSRFCAGCGLPLAVAPPLRCVSCGLVQTSPRRFCPECGAAWPGVTAEKVPVAEIVAREEVPVGVPVEEPPPRPLPPRRAPVPTAAVVPGWHSPSLALLLGLLIPGAGQAYNGQPIKGFFLF